MSEKVTVSIDGKQYFVPRLIVTQDAKTTALAVRGALGVPRDREVILKDTGALVDPGRAWAFFEGQSFQIVGFDDLKTRSVKS